MIASECEPFAKTGGLADVVDALSRALGGLGHEVDVYLPLYRGVRPPDGQIERTTVTVPVPVDPGLRGGPAGATTPVDIASGQADGYRIRLVDHPASFDRPDFYVEAPGRDYPDNGARFALLGRAALEAIRAEGRPVDVLHGHDWQAGPAILSLASRYAGDAAFAGTATLETVHNLAFHGWLPRERAWQLDLPAGAGSRTGVDLLGEALSRAMMANTVSPTYAIESRTPAFGAGLDGVLRARGDRYVGILNGIDPDLWNPAMDDALPARYSAADAGGKTACRADLAARHGLDLDEAGAPLFGMVGRLDPQKGFDLLTEAAPALVTLGARLLVLGTGDATLVDGLRAVGAAAPGRVAVVERFDRDEARRIYAGSDVLLMPSRFEPSGQSQMIALRYGTVPLVRRTGGLADSIVDADADPARGNGFVFGPAEPPALVEAARRTVAAYRDRPRWQDLVRRGMAEDFSWSRSVRAYVAAYERALEIRRAGRA